ncbi:MAG: glutathione S-transferase family protein [Pseudomonadota bacterium]
MSELVLYIGNKNYSSWSFRPWFAMRALGIKFREEVVPFEMEAGNPAFAEFSPTKKVPVLQHGEHTIWESLAIIEYVNDLFYEIRLWPHEHNRRAHARSICCEMLSGFSALRSECPMNMRREPAPLGISDAAKRDVARIEQVWRECLERYGGPFLFGHISAADAMFAPVVNRLEIYCLTEDPVVLSYMDHMKEQPAWKEWEAAGRDEPWVVHEDEV